MNRFQVPETELSEAALSWIRAAYPDVIVEDQGRIALRSEARTGPELSMIWKAACSNEVAVIRYAPHRQAVADLLLR
ncbi:MAG TPA: hypothetical protein VGB54_02395 [Allosphingosinicella sp.]